MPKIVKVNCNSIKINGTCRQGYIEASYDQLLSKFGPPSELFDNWKSDAEWSIEFEDGSVATIYNWKNGKNYCGEDGLDVEDIKEWNIGGNDRRVEEWIVDYVHHSWPVFDEIRQEAQF
tara:strand:+ start:8613 stop:8969 length:357 start_codon:yes stop_codon:yes gene_type:complete